MKDRVVDTSMCLSHDRLVSSCIYHPNMLMFVLLKPSYILDMLLVTLQKKYVVRHFVSDRSGCVPRA